MKTFILVLFSALNLNASSYEVQPDTHPTLCRQMRVKAQLICQGDKSCYTAQLSQLVDQYNSELRWDDDQADLYCNY